MILAVAILLFALGLSASAFFSGSETGFYRASRVRMVLDARSGDWISRGLVWLTNNPAIFVATTLIGNNLANYFVSRSIVMGSQEIFMAAGASIDLLASVLLSPIVFLYGELLPKYLFFHAPNRMLRAVAPLFLVCMLLFSPIAWLLWVFSRVIQYVVGQAPEQTQLTLARNELQRVIAEGQAAGILFRAQRQLINGMFALANQPLMRFTMPLARMPIVNSSDSAEQMLRVARRFRASTVLVTDGRQRDPIGYLRVGDIHLAGNTAALQPQPLLVIGHRETPIGAFNRLQSEDRALARITDDNGRTIGVLSDRLLVDQLLGRT